MPAKATWSLAMIVRDEEAVLSRILSDVDALFDEIVIVDTGSVDRTREIAKSFGARVVDFEWIDDFAAARNRSFDECTSEWIFWLDADDRLPPASRQALARLKSAMPEDIDAIWLRYRYSFSNYDPNICTLSHPVVRLVRRRAQFRWQYPIHEMLQTGSERQIGYTDAWVEHRPLASLSARKTGRNLAIAEAAYAKGSREPHIIFHLARELTGAGRLPEAVERYEEFLASSPSQGSRASALVNMAVCLDTLDRQEEKLKALVQAASIDPGRAETWVLLGGHYFERGEYAAAVPFFQAARALRPPERGVLEESAYLWGPSDYLSMCKAALGRPREALQDALQALRLLGDRARIYSNVNAFLDALRAEDARKVATAEPPSKVTTPS